MAYVFQRPLLLHGADETDTATATLLVANVAQTANLGIAANGVVYSTWTVSGTGSGTGAILDLGTNKTRAANAGTIGYEALSLGNLDIVGAGTGTRRVRVWDDLFVSGGVVVPAQTASRVAVFDSTNTLANSAVTTAELDFLGGVTSSVQTQLNARANLAGATFSGPVALGSLTASRALALDASKQLAVSATTAAELGYLSGVTSAVQTQLDARANLAGAAFTGNVAAPSYSVGAGGMVGWGTGTTKTNMLCLYGAANPDATDVCGLGLSGSAVRYNSQSSGSHVFYAGGTQLVSLGASEAAFSVPVRASAALTLGTASASRAVALDASKGLVASATTDTELGYLSGVTSGVQTQLNARANISGATFSGAIAATSVSLASGGTTYGTVSVSGTSALLDLGVNKTRETNAGKIGYELFTSGALDIVGAGTVAGSRGVRIFDTLTVTNGVQIVTAPGPFAEKNYGGDGDRYGVGLYDAVTRMYAGDLYGPANVAMSYAKADGTFNDIIMASRTAVTVSSAAVLNVPGGLFLPSETASRALVLDASKEAVASNVTTAQLEYLVGVTSGVQTQLNARANLAGATFTGAVALSAQTASRALALDASSSLVASNVTTAQLECLVGVTSNIQAQLNAAGGGVPALTASRALVSNATGGIANSAVTATELGYLSGVTGGVQSQLDGVKCNIQEFTTPGTSTWTKPGNAKLVHILCFGGGGGGGGGRSATNNSSGGTGGSAGGRSESWIPASTMSATEPVVVGAGGAAGARWSGTGGGNPGANGGDSYVGNTSNVVWCMAWRGRGGSGGVVSTTNFLRGGNPAPSVACFAYHDSNAASTFTTVLLWSGFGGSSIQNNPGQDGGRGGLCGGGGGAGGAYITGPVSNVTYGGGAGGLGGMFAQPTFTPAFDSTDAKGGGPSGSAANVATAGGNGANATTYWVGGSGGGGGGAGYNANGGYGGGGGYPGGGGGGGGSLIYTAGFISGGGGNGASGYVRMTTFF